MKRKSTLKNVMLSLLLMVLVSCFFVLNALGWIPKRYYRASDFDIVTIVSEHDYDLDGVDDYTDILLGARKHVSSRPTYKSTYEAGGYPPSDIGVCTDVIIYALQHAGYNLKTLMDEDIKLNVNLYPAVDKPDPNIDFRRVRNMKVFFERFAESLTTDLSLLDQWQPGDIVIFPGHIAIISDRRNAQGYPWIIHHSPRRNYEEDGIERYEITGHYRWNP